MTLQEKISKYKELVSYAESFNPERVFFYVKRIEQIEALLRLEQRRADYYNIRNIDESSTF